MLRSIIIRHIDQNRQFKQIRPIQIWFKFFTGETDTPEVPEALTTGKHNYAQRDRRQIDVLSNLNGEECGKLIVLCDLDSELSELYHSWLVVTLVISFY